LPRQGKATERGRSDTNSSLLPRTCWSENREFRTALIDVVLKSIRGYGGWTENHVRIDRDRVRQGSQIIRLNLDDDSRLAFFQMGGAIFSDAEVES
jgi:hypothetical protein